jgi:predicted transcriptional regulator
MKTIEISVLSPNAALGEFAKTWTAAQSSSRDMTPRLAFGSLRELFLAITEQRLELLRYVAAHEGLSLRQLAQALNWNGSDLQADVAELADLGLLERDQQGALSAPYDEILIHAGIRDAA